MSSKIFFLLANGFETIEALAPLDILRRCALDVVTVSITDSLQVESAQKVKVIADAILKDVDFGGGDAVVLPGGAPGFINLRESSEVVSIVKSYIQEGKIVGAICGGPTVLGVNNLIGDYKFTCHTSVIEQMNSKNYIKEDVIIDKNLVTGIGAGKSLEFGFALAEKFVSKEQIDLVKKGMEIL